MHEISDPHPEITMESLASSHYRITTILTLVYLAVVLPGMNYICQAMDNIIVTMVMVVLSVVILRRAVLSVLSARWELKKLQFNDAKRSSSRRAQENF